jgi:hypothetical protein
MQIPYVLHGGGAVVKKSRHERIRYLINIEDPDSRERLMYYEPEGAAGENFSWIGLIGHALKCLWWGIVRRLAKVWGIWRRVTKVWG